ncbi:MAG: serine/threonine-protein phosphatase, partial [Planctomycetaceae bacterium]|nr:serine/threonine-protein phosphatase [Planctomycetaceae bacterium]
GLFLPDDEAYVLVVADGVGGRGFGELASELVLRYGWELGGVSPSWIMKYDPKLWSAVCDHVEEYAAKLQAALREHMRANPKMAGMGTTWTCVYTMDNEAIVCHAGDSRAYLYREGKLRQLTRDHTFAQELQDVGMPPEDTTRFKHILTNSFGGPRENVTIDVSHEPLQDHDRLLLCSDGLTDMVSDDDIAKALGTELKPQAVCDALQSQALANGGKDNVTIVVADYHVSGTAALRQ